MIHFAPKVIFKYLFRLSNERLELNRVTLSFEKTLINVMRKKY